MNVTAYQEKEKNEEARTGKRNAGEERKQATDFKEALCCPSASSSRPWRVGQLRGFYGLLLCLNLREKLATTPRQQFLTFAAFELDCSSLRRGTETAQTHSPPILPRLWRHVALRHRSVSSIRPEVLWT